MRKLFDNLVFKFLFTMIKILFVTLLVMYLGFLLIHKLSEDKSIMGYRLFTIDTSSMADVYDIDDVVAVKNINFNKLKVNDDIAYIGKSGGLEDKVVIHRIIKIEIGKNGEKILVTKGINSKVDDPSITSKQVIGKAIGVVPVVSNINHIVKRPVHLFVFIVFPIALIIILEILQTIMEIKLSNKNVNKTKDNVVDMTPVIISSEVIVEEPVIIDSHPLLDESIRDDVEVVEHVKKNTKAASKKKDEIIVAEKEKKPAKVSPKKKDKEVIVEKESSKVSTNKKGKEISKTSSKKEGSSTKEQKERKLEKTTTKKDDSNDSRENENEVLKTASKNKMKKGTNKSIKDDEIL